MRFGLAIKAHAPTVSRVKFDQIGMSFKLEAEARHCLPDDRFTPDDAAKIIETEQFLERILGFRVHITQVIGGD